MAVRSELEIVAINTGLSLLGEFYQQLSLIKTICYLQTTHYTHYNTGECRAVMLYNLYKKGVKARIPNPFFVDSLLKKIWSYYLVVQL